MKTSDLVVTKDKISTRKELGGISSKVLAEVNGEKVMIKGSSEDTEAFVEYFASKFANLLGIKVNKVELLNSGKDFDLEPTLCSVHWWEDKLELASKVDFSKIESYHRDILNFFDRLILNRDRHTSNWGIVDNEVFLIDNGLADPWVEPSRDLEKFDYFKNLEHIEEFIEKFVSLTKKDFVELVKMPKGLTFKLIRKRKQIINRMIKIQEYLVGGKVNA